MGAQTLIELVSPDVRSLPDAPLLDFMRDPLRAVNVLSGCELVDVRLDPLDGSVALLLRPLVRDSGRLPPGSVFLLVAREVEELIMCMGRESGEGPVAAWPLVTRSEFEVAEEYTYFSLDYLGANGKVLIRALQIQACTYVFYALDAAREVMSRLDAGKQAGGRPRRPFSLWEEGVSIIACSFMEDADNLDWH